MKVYVVILDHGETPSPEITAVCSSAEIAERFIAANIPLRSDRCEVVERNLDVWHGGETAVCRRVAASVAKEQG